VELFTFDHGYFERLRAGDPETERHFVSYFSELVRIKLRARYLPADAIEDIRQETFVRVLTAMRKDNGVERPERLGAFVNAVCNNVLMEYRRSSLRHPQMPETADEIPDPVVNVDGTLISEEAKKNVRQVLGDLSNKDSEILRAVLLEEGSKDQVCRRLGIDRDYLRVLLHRAKKNFKSRYEERHLKPGKENSRTV
jgi:RNA polymerase sigma-70 factor (ECF subfamily)